MRILKKNQLTILVIALMFVTAGYLSYTSKESVEASGEAENGEKLASIGDATLVNSGEYLEENDKQNIMNTIQEANKKEETNKVENTEKQEQNQSKQTSATKEETDDYFTNSKMEREKMYSQMLESYQKILESNNISQEQKAISEQEITKINQTKNAIMIAENLIHTKGFKDCVIFINDASVSIIVKAEKLETEQIAQIQNIISRELKAQIENIHISNK